jgi:hypothetical protein
LEDKEELTGIKEIENRTSVTFWQKISHIDNERSCRPLLIWADKDDVSCLSESSPTEQGCDKKSKKKEVN